MEKELLTMPTGKLMRVYSEEELQQALVDQKAEIVKKIEEMEIDNMANGKTIENVAKQFGVPDSIAAIRIFDIKKEELINSIK